MLRNNKYTISDSYSSKMCVFIILEMTPSYLSYLALNTVSRKFQPFGLQ